MTLQDPQPLLDKIDYTEYDRIRQHSSSDAYPAGVYSEPSPILEAEKLASPVIPINEAVYGAPQDAASFLPEIISGRVQRFGSNVDTDSISPTDKCVNTTPEILARAAFSYTKPTFCDLAVAGANIVVAENAFGSGSSREQAPKCLLATGIQAVIAKSFAFIYGRNQANNGLFGVVMKDEKFYELAQEGVDTEIDVRRKVISCRGEEFPFRLDPIEESLLAAGGLLKMYRVHGTSLFKRLQDAADRETKDGRTIEMVETRDSKLDW